MAYKICFLRNFLITKLRKFELQSCAAPKLQSCAEIIKLRKVITKLRKNYKVAQNNFYKQRQAKIGKKSSKC